MSTGAVPVYVGDVVVVPEGEYLYGQGPLRLRITEPPVTTGPHDPEWIQLTGLEIWYDRGELRDGRPRTALVRLAALRAYPPRRARAA